MNKILVLFTLLCCFYDGLAQSSTSSKGTEFWTAYMEHVNGTGRNGSQMALYITSDVATNGTVTAADGSFNIPFTIQANNVTTIDIPSTGYVSGDGTFRKGIHIQAEKAIAVYAHIYDQAVSGATLLLPVNTMGKDYYSINYTQRSNTPDILPAYSIFNIIATGDNTTVEITPTQNLLNGKRKNESFTVELQKGEVYQARSTADLTGTRVRSISTTDQDCKKIAFFSGSSKIGIGCNTNPDDFSSDNVFQQVYPTATWGKNYITVPLEGRSYDIFRIVLSDRNTNITLNGAPVQLPTPGALPYIEFTSAEPNVITADKPIQVVQYAVTQGQNLNCTVNGRDVGDPEMILLNPVEQTLTQVALFSTSKFQINRHYINVVVKTSDVASFKLDNTPYANFTPVPGNTNYSYAKIPVRAGTHTMASSGGFNAIAYGFGDHESYGYSAGTNLQNLNEYMVFYDQGSATTKTAGCLGLTQNLQLVIPYQPNKIEWDFKNSTPVVSINNPVPVSEFMRDNIRLYVYQYLLPITYNSVGDYTIVATTYSPAVDICGTKNEIQFNFNVSDFPVAAFTRAGTCLKVPVSFTDKTDPTGSTIANWLWDFGDGETSSVQNPQHTYNQPGSYNVRLTVTNANGCTDVYEEVIAIAAPPVFDFRYPAVLCAGKEVAFTGNSARTGDIKTWRWDFGDQTPFQTLTENIISHTYASPGTYTVTLIAETVDGCITEPIKHDIVISALPVVNFTLPDVCVNDDAARFINNTTINDVTDANLTYLWDFGDANASLGNPNTSADKDARHKYISPGNYQVTLTVRSAQGCEVTLTKTLTVNGDVFSGNMGIDDVNTLCSGQPVSFRNNAALNVGGVTRVEWYFDLDGNPNAKEEYSRADFPADGRFLHTYPAFNAPLFKKYRVKMIAYSGDRCFKEFPEQEIIVHAVPVINLPNLAANGVIDICSNAGPLQLAQEFNGFNGSGLFSGNGITSDGLFHPAQADIGEHTIFYTFTSVFSCEYTTTFKINVVAAPVVSVKPEYTIFEGETVLIDAQATGQSLTYKWLPETGLNNTEILQPVASPVNDTRYTLTATSTACSYTVDVLVKVLRRVKVPNAFSPNGDGFNDTWNISNILDYPDCLVTIFNRYGKVLYTSRGYGVPWNGSHNGTVLPAGTYFYIIDLNDGRKPLSGNVTIVR